MNIRRVVHKEDSPTVMMVAKFKVEPDKYIKCSFERYGNYRLNMRTQDV